MLKLRSIFVTSLLTGLVVTSNFGCGGSSSNPDTNKTDAKDALDVLKDTGGTGGSAVEVKPETTVTDASDAKDAVDAADTGDVAKDSVDVAETGDVAKDSVDATDGSEAGETTPPTCPTTPICVLTNKRCGPGGGTQTCVIATSGANIGCPDWNAETACGAHQTCGSGTCACNTAPAGCTAEGTFCDANSAKATCAKDAQGCFFVSVAAAACPTNQSCTGALPTASCTCNNTNCTAAGLTCADSHTVRTCSADGSALHCLVAADSSCGPIKTCSGGACACPASTGTHENEGCNRATNADICDANHILTCVRDTDSGCDIWKVAPDGLCESDNGG
ncbi:MAG TPA: hypothetical protein VNO55_29745, partial [Polyangia bacterium]|nr:hypothetical protein [Polyangia bacterium]